MSADAGQVRQFRMVAGRSISSAARKVTLCHHTGSKKNPHRTITVSRSALAAHMRHGDTVGPCTTAPTIRKHSTSAHVRKFHKNQTLRSEIRRETKRRP